MAYVPFGFELREIWTLIAGESLQDAGLGAINKEISDLSAMKKELKRILGILAEVAAAKVRQKIDEKGLVKTGAMRAGITAVEKRDHIIIESKKEYAKYLDKGVKPHSMTYMKGRTVPFVAFAGKLQFAGKGSKDYGSSNTIFRKATEKSLAAGSWFHPGIKAHNFFEEGLQDAIDEVQEDFPLFELTVRFT